MAKGVEERALGLARSGLPLIHLEASYNGTAVDDPSRSMRDVIRSVHRTLVEGGVRDSWQEGESPWPSTWPRP